MRNWLRSVWRTRIGKFGAFLVALKPLWDLVSFLGDVSFIVTYIAPIFDLLDTSYGTLLLVGIGLYLIYRASIKQPQNEPMTEAATEPEPDEELDQLRAELREVKEDRDRLQRELYENREPRHFGSAVLPDAAPPGTIDNLTNENERLRQEIGRLKDQVSEKELRQRALELSDKLLRFSDQWNVPPVGTPDPEHGLAEIRRVSTIWAQYHELLEGQVRSLFEILDSRGLVDSEERGKVQNPGSLSGIREIAQRLAAIGRGDLQGAESNAQSAPQGKQNESGFQFRMVGGSVNSSGDFLRNERKSLDAKIDVEGTDIKNIRHMINNVESSKDESLTEKHREDARGPAQEAIERFDNESAEQQPRPDEKREG